MDILLQLSKPCDQDPYFELKPQSKIPVATGWPNIGQATDIALSRSHNLKIVLGALSGLLDVNLDCMEAKVLADVILPEPAVKFDRG